MATDTPPTPPTYFNLHPGRMEITVAHEWLRYNICEPSIMSLVSSALQPANYNRRYLLQVCAFMSFPKLREALGPDVNPAWYPTKGKLMRAIIVSAIKSPILNTFPRTLRSLTLLTHFITTKDYGSDLVDLCKLAVPIGILPPITSQYKYLPVFLDFLSFIEPNWGRSEILQYIFSSRRLNEYLKPDFDASYLSTYGELIDNIFSNLNYNFEFLTWISDNSDVYKANISRTAFGKQKFNPQLLYELNLPPVSPVHDPFIKELLFTTIDPYHNKVTRGLEERLNDGRILGMLQNFNLKAYKKKDKLLKNLLGAYITQLEGQIQSMENANNEIVFLADQLQLDYGGDEPVEPEMLAALLGIRKELYTPPCRNHAHFLLDSFQHSVPISIIPLCYFLNTVNIRTLLGHPVDLGQYPHSGILLHSILNKVKASSPKWYKILKNYKSKIRK